MVMKTIEMGYEVEEERQGEVMKKIKELYPELGVFQKENKIFVRGDLSNYKRRGMIMWILSGGKHGKNLQTS